MAASDPVPLTDLARAKRLNALLEAALATGLDCYAFAVANTEDDPQLRQELLDMLQLEVPTRFFQEQPAMNLNDLLAASWQPGYRLGTYEIEAELGRGGMGAVYRARRADESFEKKVAIKLMRPTLYGPETLQRFHEERQILARLEHPNIARLLDGGTTPEGIPYLVMEYIEGLPITRYCDERCCTLDERLRLFRDLCGAVQHAHRHLVAHRDLKPDNILVTGEGVVKLLDFGIARVLEPRGDLYQTRTGQRLMSPLYASPEQVLGRDITIATDIYSLGVVLFQLCSGSLPYVLTDGSLEELSQQIVSRPPLRLVQAWRRAGQGSVATASGSGLVTTSSQGQGHIEIARRLGLAPKALGRRLKSDLESVVLKCLEKEAASRYDSTGALIEDLERFQQGFPVSARGYSATLVLLKFMQRHKAISALTVAVFLLAAAFTFQLSLKNRRILEERDLAQAQTKRAESITQFIVDIFKYADPNMAGNKDIKAEELLDHAYGALKKQRQHAPSDRAQLLHTLAEIQIGMGNYALAEEQLLQALALYRDAKVGLTREYILAISDLSLLMMLVNRLDRAEALALEAQDKFQRSGLVNTDLEGTILNNLSQVYATAQKTEQAEAMLHKTITFMEALNPQPSVKLGRAVNTLGCIRYQKGDLVEAEHYLREALKYARMSFTETPDLSSVLSNLGLILNITNRQEEAEAMLREALAINRKSLGQHLTVSANLANLAKVLIATGRYQEAQPLLLEDREILVKFLGPDHIYVALNLQEQGIIAFKTQNREQALAVRKEALAIFRKNPGQEEAKLKILLQDLVTQLKEQGHIQETSTYRDQLARLTSR